MITIEELHKFKSTMLGRFTLYNKCNKINRGGIYLVDNNGWNDARSRYNSCVRNPIKYPTRIDFFFTGWLPTKPGEIIRVETVQDVRKYPFKVLVEVQSTMPVSQ
jgi:hypothetical protein